MSEIGKANVGNIGGVKGTQGSQGVGGANTVRAEQEVGAVSNSIASIADKNPAVGLGLATIAAANLS